MEVCDLEKRVTELHLQEISRNRCEDWAWLYSHLNMSQIIVNDIQKSKAKEKDRRLEFFQKWEKENGDKATYFKLLQALIANKSIADAEYVCELLVKKKRNTQSLPTIPLQTSVTEEAPPSATTLQSSLPHPAPHQTNTEAAGMFS